MIKKAVIILFCCLALVGCNMPDVMSRKVGQPLLDDTETAQAAPTLAASPAMVLPTAEPPTITPSATVGLQATIDYLVRQNVDITAQVVGATESEADRQMQYVQLTAAAEGTQAYFAGLTATAAPTALPLTATQGAFDRAMIGGAATQGSDNATATAYAPVAIVELAEAKDKAANLWFYNLCDALLKGGVGVAAVLFSVSLLRVITKYLPNQPKPGDPEPIPEHGWLPLETPETLPQGWLPATPDELFTLAKAVKAGKRMVFTDMAGPNGTFSRGVWQRIRQELINKHYAQLINPRDEKSAIEFTAKGDQLLEPYISKIQAVPQSQAAR